MEEKWFWNSASQKCKWKCEERTPGSFTRKESKLSPLVTLFARVLSNSDEKEESFATLQFDKRHSIRIFNLVQVWRHQRNTDDTVIFCDCRLGIFKPSSGLLSRCILVCVCIVIYMYPRLPLYCHLDVPSSPPVLSSRCTLVSACIVI
ncbi:hypothetical protein CDAR_242821 [Caerostris darwini]|uniref:Uncharacterized protein n=1 Tax=Caerostris darwini TaxID=1538125 RepID=A0AAV4W1B2_9ARAC|nr:hypothetical protein CDAR_242821 [Caerostris darwini]